MGERATGCFSGAWQLGRTDQATCRELTSLTADWLPPRLPCLSFLPYLTLNGHVKLTPPFLEDHFGPHKVTGQEPRVSEGGSATTIVTTASDQARPIRSNQPCCFGCPPPLSACP